MSNPAVDVIRESLDRMMVAMSQGDFSYEDLGAVRKVFSAGVEATDKLIALALEVETSE
jgi:hypothetical protein